MPEQRIPPPDALAIGICDLIHRDPGTGKRFILGCFTAVHALEFPAVHPLMGVYLDLTNGRGKVQLRVQIVDTDEEREPIWSVEQEIEFGDPRIVAELDFMIGGLTFPEPGEYRVQVYVANQFVIERRLLVHKVEKPHEQ
jgi:hypothetical protein